MINLVKTKEMIRFNFLLHRQADLTAHDVQAAREYIEAYWQQVKRVHLKDDETLLGLPKPYLVPSYDQAANFDDDELYYWDSYFMVQGMLDDAHQELVRGILEDLISLFKRFKIIPNASRTYLMGRSQPPLLTTFIFDAYEAFKLDKTWLKESMSVAKQEYAIVWMGMKKPNDRQVYRGLSRYYDINMLHDLAEAESGWDMTPRFERRALHYLPVDLNALLYKYETDFARAARILGNESEAAEWDKAAEARKAIVNELMWDRIRGLYYDYNYVKDRRSNISSLAAYFPMWAGMVDANQAASLVRALRRFEQKGGLSTTDAVPVRQYMANGTPTQWAYPNGWAPLHFMVIKGLERYGYHDDARRIAMKWLKCNLWLFDTRGVFLEKYNVANPEKPPVKGVYPTQTGFGWTNAIFERLCRDYIDTQPRHKIVTEKMLRKPPRRPLDAPVSPVAEGEGSGRRFARDWDGSSARQHRRPSRRISGGRFFPARPRRLWSHMQAFARSPFTTALRVGPPRASNAAYVRWLKHESMLEAADKLARKYSGRANMWRNPYAKSRPLTAVRQADVWYTAYPISHMTKTGQSILSTLGEEALWQQFETIGIDAVHTGPMKLAGGLEGWTATPSIDGYFDRISTRLDPTFGTEAEFQHMSDVAKQHGGIVIDDIIPGHTGKGADFRLAEMGYEDYPGIYHMVEIDPQDWFLLPDVPAGRDCINLSSEAERALKEHSYIIGKLPRVIFYEKGVKETNWSVTRVVRGVDGVSRRWVYLHYFKEGQPTINWLDPSFAGMRLVIGDALHSLGRLGSRGVRLDANGFLGIEKGGEGESAWSEGHPLSKAANLMIAGTVRKLGGFTFQEVNLTFEDIKALSEFGADLSYDFINRPAYHHALVMADAEFLRLAMRSARATGINPGALVHALQNHDDLTYELVHFWTAHKDDVYSFRGKEVRGEELRQIIRRDLQERVTGEKAPYNLLFTENGIACTTASIITATLGITDLQDITEAQIKQIIRMHLLLAMFNAWQPGVFALSGWDLVGSLPLPAAAVSDLVADGDTRWINRGGYKLLADDTPAEDFAVSMPQARSLYGSLPRQLADETSFASRLRAILSIRKEYGIATASQIDIPDVPHKSLFVMVHRLENQDLQLTVLNFGPEDFTGPICSEHLPAGSAVVDVSSGRKIATVTDDHAFSLVLEAYAGRFLVVRTPLSI